MSCISTKKVVIELHLSTRCLTPYRQRLVCIQQKEKQELLAATKFVCYNCITNLLYTLGVRKAWWSKLYAVYFNQQMVLLTLFPLWNVPFSVCLTFLPHYEGERKKLINTYSKTLVVHPRKWCFFSSQEN